MPTVLYTAILPYSGRAVRFERASSSIAFQIAESAELAAGDGASRMKMTNETVRETVRVCLRGITMQPVPLVKLDDGTIDEEATLRAIERDEDAAAKGCPWRSVGHLDMITADSDAHLYKLFPEPDDLMELYLLISRAGARQRLPLAGKPRMTVQG